jgi:hypothetical protein
MKKILIILGAVILAAAIAGGSFYGGMAYQRSQANNIRDSFLRERGLAGDSAGVGGVPGAGAPGTGADTANRPGGGFPGGGITGQVKSVEGSTLSLSTPQNVTTVTLSADTRIEMASAATLADLQPGQQVMVTGARDEDGNITAVRVYILGSDASGEAPSSTP